MSHNKIEINSRNRRTSTDYREADKLKKASLDTKKGDFSISKSQFIFWIFTAFSTGISVAVAMLNYLKK
jgi:hypothetical protein